MIVYFAGVNTRHFCEAFIGHHVLETFTDPRARGVYGRYRAVFKSMALDCGAFTKSIREGREKIDIYAYADFVAAHGNFYDFCASLDSIAGGVDENVANWLFLQNRGLRTMPTYHQGEPLDVLRNYCGSATRIGLGFKRDKNARTSDEIPFLDEAFSVIPPEVQVHGWAMTGYTARYPFASVDSTTWLYEVKALRAAQTTQGSPFDHLTDGELIEIVQKKYDRLPRTQTWQGRGDARPQLLLTLAGKAKGSCLAQSAAPSACVVPSTRPLSEQREADSEPIGAVSRGTVHRDSSVPEGYDSELCPDEPRPWEVSG